MTQRFSIPVLCTFALSTVSIACGNEDKGTDPSTDNDAPQSGDDTETGTDTESSPSGNPETLLIDDINDCDDVVINQEHGLSGYWYVTNANCDEGMAGEQTPGCDEDPVPMETIGDDNCAARTFGGGFPNSESEGWGWALIGIQFDTPFDACDWAGIGLAVSGTPVRVKATTPDTMADSDHYGATLSAGIHKVPWDELAQEGWGTPREFDCSTVGGVFFQASTPVEFDFTVDDIVFFSKDDPVDDGPTTEVPDDREPGDFLDRWNNTYYWFLDEADYDGDAAVALLDENCEPLVSVNAGFADDVCMEGSGRLADGRIINLTGTCECGHPCGDTGEGTCFFLPDPDRFPWGVGSNDNPLEPLVSWAVNDVEYGTVLYAPVWDGLEIPEIDGLGGFRHDGCFRVDDVGYSFGGTQADVFVGTPAMFNALEGLIPTFSGLDVYDGATHCSHLAYGGGFTSGERAGVIGLVVGREKGAPPI